MILKMCFQIFILGMQAAIILKSQKLLSSRIIRKLYFKKITFITLVRKLNLTKLSKLGNSHEIKKKEKNFNG